VVGDRQERLLGVALVVITALALIHPGVEGDTLRGLSVALAGLLLGAHAALSPRRGGPGGWALLGFGAVLGCAALQLVPLPRGVLEALSPTAGALYGASEGAAGVGPEARPLSLGPSRTGRCLLLGAAYLGVFCVARARRRVAATTALTACGALLTLGALGALALQTDRSQWAMRARWPLVNPNHLGTALVLCLGAGIGVTLSRVSPRVRTAAGLGVALIVVGIVATRSRGALLAAALTCALTLLLASLRGGQSAASAPRSLRRRVLAALGVVLALGIGLGLSDAEPLKERFAHTDPQRAGLSLGARPVSWGLAWRIARGAPWAGAGLGTFDEVSLSELDPEIPRWTRPGAAHNDYLELAAGVGWPAAILAFLALIAVLAQATRRTLQEGGTSRALRAGCLGGAVGALAHSAIDFPLHAPGSALLFFCTLGLAQGSPRLSPAGPWRRRLTLGCALLLILGGVAWAALGVQQARARASFERVVGVREGLRAAQANRVLPQIEAGAASLGAPGELSALLAQALLIQAAGEQNPSAMAKARVRALELTRAAVRRSPTDGRLRAQLSTLLLLQPGTFTAARRREVEGQLRLAVAWAPTFPGVLRQGAWVALELRVRTGEPSFLQLAELLLRRLLVQRPGEGRRIAATIRSLAPRLGRGVDHLLRRLGLD
jgi:O-antigen ligase